MLEDGEMRWMEAQWSRVREYDADTEQNVHFLPAPGSRVEPGSCSGDSGSSLTCVLRKQLGVARAGAGSRLARRLATPDHAGKEKYGAAVFTRSASF